MKWDKHKIALKYERAGIEWLKLIKRRNVMRCKIRGGASEAYKLC